MFKNKLVNIMLVILISLTLLGVIALILVNIWNSMEASKGKEPTIEEIVKLSFDTPEITTNLMSNDFARMRFRIQVDNKKALEEVQKRDFQIDNIIIRELAGMQSSELKSPEGIEQLETRLKMRINELMQEGIVIQVYTRERMIQ